MGFDIEKLEYLLGFVEDYLTDFIDEILHDSDVDPHYSAVTATNMIKCYIEIMNDFGKELPYSDVKSYFEFNAYTKEEYQQFESSRERESKYYTSKQF